MNSEMAGLFGIAFLLALIIIGVLVGVYVGVAEWRLRRQLARLPRPAVAMPFRPNLPPSVQQCGGGQPAVPEVRPPADQWAPSPMPPSPVVPVPPRSAPPATHIEASLYAGDDTVVAQSLPELELVVTEGEGMGCRFPLTGDTVAIGRIDEADLPVRDPLCSRRHAEMRFKNGIWYVGDLYSKNGTYLNEMRLVGDAKPVQPGDQIRIGHTILTVRMIE